MMFKMKKKDNINKVESSTEHEIDVNRLISCADNGCALNNEEMKIYLKHLIANKDKYINHLYKYKEIGSFDDGFVRGILEGLTGVISGIITGIGMISIILNLVDGNIPGIITCLTIIGMVDIPTSIFFVANRVIRRKIATNKVNRKISDLQNAISLDDSTKLDKSLVEIKETLKSLTAPSVERSKDAFIEIIENDMRTVVGLKYLGYEKDLLKLVGVAESYITRRQEMNGTDTLLFPSEWFKTIAKIELKFKNLSEFQTEQADLIASLARMKEILTSENIIYQVQDETAEKDDEYTPRLML